ncbi:tyrosine-protein phosphatase [Nocardioides albidus]|uniref:tyrosine-protein phosphatase n=1 Tax=Nocardioides albidus TaxID=1517589 RepID=UPI0013050A1F|nr:tyrosine-protein phosphatase [Nocardioides albidus]
MSEATRWLDLVEVDNVRDLGGLPLAGGGVTRSGVAYRASTLQQACAADVTELVDVRRLRTVIDLRLPDEAAREGHGLLGDAGVRVVNLPVRKADATLLDVVVPSGTSADLGALYWQLLAGSTEAFVESARIIADPEQHAVLFHCAAGKDRTGVIAAVLLDAVGVPADAIAADYALTSERAARVRERLVRIPAYQNLPNVGQGVFAVDGTAIASFVDALRATYGGGGEFLLRHGLTDAELAGLRAALVG